MEFQEVSREVDAIAKEIVDAAFNVHRNLGPGLLESVYEICLMHELNKRNLDVENRKEYLFYMMV